MVRTHLACRGPFIWSIYADGKSYVDFDVGFLKGIAKLDKSLHYIRAATGRNK